jgi:hypothetical protein
MKLSGVTRLTIVLVTFFGLLSCYKAENLAWAQSAVEANAQYNMDKTINFPAELAAILPAGFVKDTASFGAGFQSNVGFSVHGIKHGKMGRDIYLSYEYRWYNRSDPTGNFAYEQTLQTDVVAQEGEIGAEGEEKGKEPLENGVLSWSKQVIDAFGEPRKIYYSCKWIGQVGNGWLIITMVSLPESKGLAYTLVPKICEKISKLNMQQYLAPVVVGASAEE